MIRIINANDPNTDVLLSRQPAGREEAAANVSGVLAAVKTEGDAALCRLTKQYDKIEIKPEQIKVSKEEIDSAYLLVDDDFLAALRLARDNIVSFHTKQLSRSWFEPDSEGNILGQLIRPLTRVGIYVPGGTASYPSSVLMNSVPAQVAGVREIAMVTPPGSDGRVNPYTLVAAAEAGVTEIYRVGGAQAIAALAYGTETIGKVDKITGPGNLYVTLAKQQVYGQVDIDMLAGPSEILVVADSSADPRYAAADLLSQAEHDVLASAILLTPDQQLAKRVQQELAAQLAVLPRANIASQSINNYSAIILTRDIDEAIELANRFAPEHLELMVAEPFQWLGKITNAGAIFLGANSPEPVGDYLAGPNHVLPTGGTARFYSPLSVDTFMKKSSIIAYSRKALEKTGRHIMKLAGVEGLEAHANAVRIRLAGGGGSGE